MIKKIYNATVITVFGVTTLLSSPALSEEVYMIRGFMNVFSDGMNEMTQNLKKKGVRAKTIQNGNWGTVADDIIKRSKHKKVSYPIIIAGHSLGGVQAVSFANKLGKAGVPTALLIGLDPGFPVPPPLRKGAEQVVNYKIPSGQNFRKGTGFNGEIKTIDVSKYGTDHIGIDENKTVQKMILQDIMKHVKIKKSGKKTTS